MRTVARGWRGTPEQPRAEGAERGKAGRFGFKARRGHFVSRSMLPETRTAVRAGCLRYAMKARRSAKDGAKPHDMRRILTPRVKKAHLSTLDQNIPKKWNFSLDSGQEVGHDIGTSEVKK